MVPIKYKMEEEIKERYKRIEESSYDKLNEHEQITKAYLMRQRRATNAKGSDGMINY